MRQDHNSFIQQNHSLDDFNAELSGTKSGYIYTTSAASDDNRSSGHVQKAKKAQADILQLTVLQQLLDDPAYAKSYSEALSTIETFKERMNKRLNQLDLRIEELDKKQEDLATDSPEHKRLSQKREDLQRKQQDLLDYYHETVKPVEDRMNDPDNPPSKEELDDFNEKVQKDSQHIFDLEHKAILNEKAPPIERTANLEIPTL
ncbi:MAG: hypothetical protein HWE30_03610 [Methylocystaceae bacterium]|nr:hypothetical protein [Methylocystaceae bacterium]